MTGGPVLPSCALVFMANDRYRDWAVAFLESVRALDARLPLYCIPHRGSFAAIRLLRHTFGFEILEEGIERLDAFARRLYRFHPRHRANLRKYAALTLPVSEVAYFDIDLLLLVEPRRLFGHIRPGEIDLVYFATSPGWVYKARHLARAMSLFPDLRMISAGAFVTSPGALTIDEIVGTVEENWALYRELRRRRVYDQPVLNFALHRLGKRYRSIADLDPSLAGLVSFRNPNLQVVGGKPIDVSGGGEVVAIHWAGARKLRSDWAEPRTLQLRGIRKAALARGDERIRASAGQQRASSNDLRAQGHV